MTNAYRMVQWNRHKRVYDAVLAAGCVVFVAAFVGASLAVHRPPAEISPPVLLMRALGLLAIVLLHVILAIGPLARLSDRFAPLLYNRRHLGVTFFLVALLHAAVAVGFYGGFGVRDPVSAVLDAPARFGSVSAFPFELLGFAALIVFFVMAATSHDFWLANLSARWWKRLHMLVYVAYALVLGHVALGAARSEPSLLFPLAMVAGLAGLVMLHTGAGLRERRRDRAAPPADADGWVDACGVDELSDGEGRVVCVAGGERLAVFREGDRVGALTNVCAHQGGPLGEGRIVGGCVTCPWHGYQYRLADGASPPPYTEKIATHETRVREGRVEVRVRGNAPGTPRAMPRLHGGAGDGG